MCIQCNPGDSHSLPCLQIFVFVKGCGSLAAGLYSPILHNVAKIRLERGLMYPIPHGSSYVSVATIRVQLTVIPAWNRLPLESLVRVFLDLVGLAFPMDLTLAPRSHLALGHYHRRSCLSSGGGESLSASELQPRALTAKKVAEDSGPTPGSLKTTRNASFGRPRQCATLEMLERALFGTYVANIGICTVILWWVGFLNQFRVNRNRRNLLTF